MREIKFRFYNRTNNKLIYPDTNMGNFSDLQESMNWKVMQYTGLKDKNGVEIYEEDIVKHDKADKRYREKQFIIEFWEAWGRYIAIKRRPGGSDLFELTGTGNQAKDFEVLGNIYETPI